MTRRTRRDSYAKYLIQPASDHLDDRLDDVEKQAIQVLAKQFRVRLLERPTQADEWANGTDDPPNPTGSKTPTEP